MSSIILVASGLYFGNNTVKKDRFNLWLLLLILWFMFIYLAHMQGWSIAFNAFIGLMVYYTAIKTLVKDDVKFLIKGIGWVAGSAVFYLALQFWNFDVRGFTLASQGTTPRCSFFALEAAFGAYLAMSIPLLLTLSWVAFLFFIPLIFSWSTGAYAGAVISTLFYLWYKRRLVFWRVLGPLIIIAACFVTFVDNPMGMQKTRIAMWKLVIQDSFRKPLVGHGLDSFRESKKEGDGKYLKPVMNDQCVKAIVTDKGLFIKGAPSQEMVEKFKRDGKIFDFWDHPHNEIIWIFYETGVGGLILFGFFIFQLWQRFIKSKMSKETVASAASIIAVLIYSQTQFPFHMARLAHIVPVILAIFYISTDESKPQVMI